MEVREVALAPGEPYELRLTGRGARGYVWTWRVTGDADAISVSQGPAGPSEGPSAGPEGPSGAPVPGATVERVYVVRGRAAGRARIRFAQVRPPYPDEAPLDEFVLDVVVS